MLCASCVRTLDIDYFVLDVRAWDRQKEKGIGQKGIGQLQ